MALESVDEKRMIRHFYNITNECTAVVKLLDNDDVGEYANIKEFVNKARKAFKGFVLISAGERDIELA